VVVARAGLALVRVQEPIKDVVDKLRREPGGSASPSRRAKKTSKSRGQPSVARARGPSRPSPARAAHVVFCTFAMPPSRFSHRCLVLLLLVAVAAGVLARPAEAGTRPFADIVAAAPERPASTPAWCTWSSPSSSGTAQPRNRRPAPRA